MANDKPLTGKEKRLQTLTAETERQKKVLVIQLRKTPIVQVACERVGVGRATYYKWRAEDFIFARAADHALKAGKFFINDMAESQLIKLIKNENLTAIIFWLKHNHPKYAVNTRHIPEYEIVTLMPSVEESNLSAQDLSRMIAIKLVPKFSAEEVKERVEIELEQAEQDEELRKKLKFYEDDPEPEKLST